MFSTFIGDKCSEVYVDQDLGKGYLAESIEELSKAETIMKLNVTVCEVEYKRKEDWYEAF